MELAKRIEKKIAKLSGRAIRKFRMIEPGDRVLVALSGGKDSWTLLHLLHTHLKHVPFDYEITAVTVHPGFEGFNPKVVERYCNSLGFKHFTEKTLMNKVVEKNINEGTTYCSFCARLRRGVLYAIAQREGFNKVALGHHADDLIETLLMAQLFTGEIKSMPPVLHADDGKNIVIRPLCLVFEELIVRYAEVMDFPLIECGCPVHDEGRDQKRHRIKALLAQLEAEHPTIKASLLSSLGRVRHRFLMG